MPRKLLGRYSSNAVCVTGRLRDNQKACGPGRRIAELVSNTGEDSDPAACRDQRGSSFHFHNDLAGKDVEKLLGLLMIVANFSSARRHEFFNHTQILVFDQMPPIALVPPPVMLGGFAADRPSLTFGFRHDFCLPRWTAESWQISPDK